MICTKDTSNEEELRLFSNIKVNILKVIQFSQLDAMAPQPNHPQFLFFGTEGHYYVAHKIAGKPSFDQVLRLENLEYDYRRSCHTRGCEPAEELRQAISRTLNFRNLMFSHADTNSELIPGDKVYDAGGYNGFIATIGAEIYFERNELSF